MADISDLIWKGTAGTAGDVMRAFGYAQELVQKDEEWRLRQKLGGYQLQKEQEASKYYAESEKLGIEKKRQEIEQGKLSSRLTQQQIDSGDFAAKNRQEVYDLSKRADTARAREAEINTALKEFVLEGATEDQIAQQILAAKPEVREAMISAAANSKKVNPDVLRMKVADSEIDRELAQLKREWDRQQMDEGARKRQLELWAANLDGVKAEAYAKRRNADANMIQAEAQKSNVASLVTDRLADNERAKTEKEARNAGLIGAAAVDLWKYAQDNGLNWKTDNQGNRLYLMQYTEFIDDLYKQHATGQYSKLLANKEASWYTPLYNWIMGNKPATPATPQGGQPSSPPKTDVPYNPVTGEGTKPGAKTEQPKPSTTEASGADYSAFPTKLNGDRTKLYEAILAKLGDKAKTMEAWNAIKAKDPSTWDAEVERLGKTR